MLNRNSYVPGFSLVIRLIRIGSDQNEHFLVLSN